MCYIRYFGLIVRGLLAFQENVIFLQYKREFFHIFFDVRACEAYEEIHKKCRKSIHIMWIWNVLNICPLYIGVLAANLNTEQLARIFLSTRLNY